MPSLSLTRLLHGGDWNPDQWLHAPEVIDEDFRLFPLAGANFMSVGIFAWAALEPEEGRFAWAWLDRILDRMHAQGMAFFLATPSGARPAWLSIAHPEVRRVLRDGRREDHGWRHNHCPSSPIYRRHVARIDRALAERYGSHPGLLGWHISNELNGECWCDLCKQGFRDWLRARHGDIGTLNRAWWSAFWSHTYPSFAHIDGVDPSNHGMVIDWRRFMSDLFVDWTRHETAALRAGGSQAPVTTNLMAEYFGLDYRKLAAACDFVSWDSYPPWHSQPDGDIAIAAHAAFCHDLMRGLKRDARGPLPWVMMESAPGITNWMAGARPMRPGLQRTSSLQAVAHGSDAVGYFQWRKGRGGCEKHHGAVVDHAGHDTRIFREVASLGAELRHLAPIAGSRVLAPAAVVCDYETQWALEQAAMGNNAVRAYLETVRAHHRALWEQGLDVDVIGPEDPLEVYRLVVAPMLYQLRPGVADRLARFVAGGGRLLATYLTGVTDITDNCILGGVPGDGLRALFGVRTEELDFPPAADGVELHPVDASPAGIAEALRVQGVAELIHAEDAAVAAVYRGAWYDGQPALTMRAHGAGEAWYCAARLDPAGQGALAGALVRRAGIAPLVPGPLPPGIAVRSRRGSDGCTYLFAQNFSAQDRELAVGAAWTLAEDGAPAPAAVALPPYGTVVLARPAQG